MEAEKAYNQVVKENLEILSKIKKHIKWGEKPEAVNWCDVGNQGYVNQQLKEIAQFLGVPLADKKD